MTRSKKQFDIGERRYRHDGFPGVSWGEPSHCVQQLRAQGYEVVEADVLEEDTRKTVKEVVDEIHRQERRTWDEYVSSSGTMSSSSAAITKWPARYRGVAVYVMTGGSEGYYLHVELNGVVFDDGTREDGKLMIVAKSLGSTWRQCWASAGRIAKMLGA